MRPYHKKERGDFGQLRVVVHTVIPASERLRQEELNVEAILT